MLSMQCCFYGVFSLKYIRILHFFRHCSLSWHKIMGSYKAFHLCTLSLSYTFKGISINAHIWPWLDLWAPNFQKYWTLSLPLLLRYWFWLSDPAYHCIAPHLCSCREKLSLALGWWMAASEGPQNQSQIHTDFHPWDQEEMLFCQKEKIWDISIKNTCVGSINVIEIPAER